jgi:hypothetical protein
MATHAANTIGRCAGKEELPLPEPLANRARLLQVQHLAQRHAPEREDILVKEPTPGGRPALERGGVASDGREVAVVQPGLHLLGLLDAGPGAVLAQRQRRRRLLAARVVVLGPPGPDQQDVPDGDIAALRRRPYVDPLRLADLRQARERDGVRLRRVVLDALAGGPRAVVQEDGPTREAVQRPVVDRTLEVVRALRVYKVRGLRPVVERLRRDVGEVSEAVPLSARLCIQVVGLAAGLGVWELSDTAAWDTYIVVRNTFVERLDRMSERLTTKRRLGGYIEREIESGHVSSLDLSRRGFDPRGRKKVETSDIIICSPYPCRLLWCTWY